MRSAAPQTTLWGGPRPIFEPGTGDLESLNITIMIITFLLYENAKVGQPHPLHDPLQRGKDAPVLGVQAPVHIILFLASTNILVC